MFLLGYLRRHHWGLIATVISLTGTAYAATELPPNSVGTRQIQSHAVTLSKVSLGAQRALRGRVGPIGPRGRVGPIGPRGRVGAVGPAGPSDGYYSSDNLAITGFFFEKGASVTVPPGGYIAAGGCTASQGNGTGQSITSLTFGTALAILSATPAGQTPTPPYQNEPGTVSSVASVPNEGYAGTGHNGYHFQAGAASLSTSGGFSLPKGGTITETCEDEGNDAGVGGKSIVSLNYSGYYLSAIRVASLHAGGSTG